jgi:hypothetical protein
MTTATSVWVAFGLTFYLAALHLAAPRLRRMEVVDEAILGSFAGGMAIAYVFLHILPDLVEGNERLAELLGGDDTPTPLAGMAIFLVALGGFTVFYGLQRLAERSMTRSNVASVYGLHLGAFAVQNLLIAYTMPLRAQSGLGFALLFSFAIGLHYVLVDRALEKQYQARFERTGRPALVVALLVGWLLAALFPPVSIAFVAVITALIAGSVLWNVFKEEVPASTESNYLAFLGGVLTYGGLLALLTAASG